MSSDELHATLSIRNAERVDVPALNALAWAAKASHGYPPEQMEAWRTGLTLKVEDLRVMRVRMISLRDEALGFYALRPRPGRWRIEHFWVRPEIHRKGIGRMLVEDALAAAKAHWAAVMVESDPNATGFWEKVGGRRAGVAVSPSLADPHHSIPIYELE